MSAKARRWAVSIAIALAFSLACGRIFGPSGLIAAGVVSFLGIAVRHDNELGYCLFFAILFLLTIAVLVFVAILTGIMHGAR